MSEEIHPALAAARNSWARVMAKDKEGWLALMADDVLVEDPIGVGPTNPTGEGLRGKAALSEFFDQNIAPNTMIIEPQESYAAGLESGHVLVLRTTFPDGTIAIVRGVFTYKLNEAGKITNLRGYWNMEGMTFEKAEG